MTTDATENHDATRRDGSALSEGLGVAVEEHDDAALRLRPVRRDYAPDLPIVQAPRAWARAVAKLDAAAD
jgi:hypothetical protein